MIELDDSDSDEEVEETFEEPRRVSLPARMKRPLSLAQSSNDPPEDDDLWVSDEDEELEFEG